MLLEFDRRNARLHVGYRRTDWSDVWMVLINPPGDDPDAYAENPDGEYDYEFYERSTGEQVRRAPMPGEIIWHSHFDPTYCDSRIAPEKKKLHHRFMSDAHLYLCLNNPAQIRKWEQKLNNPRAARWQSWFDIAQRYQRRRHPELRQPGDDNGDDDDDSAYDSDDEHHYGNVRPMGPPRRPGSRNKRKAPGNGRKESGSKRTKLSADGSQTRLSDRYFQMSGGLGAPSTQSASIPRSINGDYDNGSEIYDPNPPEHKNNVIEGHDLDHIRSPLGFRSRGDSGEENIPPFNEWDQNAGPRRSAGAARNPAAEQNEDQRRIQAINGDLDEDAAYEFAREQSMNPNTSINGDLDEDAAYEFAREASILNPIPSIET